VIIGFDSKRAMSNATGLGNYARFVLEILSKYHPDLALHAYAPKKGNFEAELNSISGLEIHYPKSSSKTPLWRSFGIGNDLQKDRIEIFHGLSNEVPFGLKLPSVVTIHDLIFLRYPNYYPIVDRFVYKQKVAYAAERCERIIAISQQTKRDLVDFLKVDETKIEVIYQDCHTQFHGEVSAETKLEVLKKYGLAKPYILCVGTIEDRKNQLALIQAFETLDLKSDFELVFVGKPKAHFKTIQKYLAGRDIARKIKFIHQVAFTDLPALYQLCHTFAYVSQFEGFGIPIVEALHSGKPVLSSIGSCFTEAGGEAAIYANPLDISDIAVKLEQLLYDETLRNELASKIPNQLEKFNHQHLANQFVEVYKALV